MNSLHIKKGDTVLVIAGKDKGKKGKVMSCDPSSCKAMVDGINIVTKHSKPKNRETSGGIRKMVGNIDISNLMLVCPACDKPSRLGHKTLANGKKVRACKKCGAGVEPQIKGKDKKKKTDKPVKEESAVKSEKLVKEEKVVKTDKPKRTVKPKVVSKEESAEQSK